MNKQEKPVYFFDTYAFFEIIKGNPDYKKFEDVYVITTIFNLAELNYGLKKEKSKGIAVSYTKKYWVFLVNVSLEDLEKATDLKVKNKHLSIPDAIGYIVAEKHNVKFLTGDEDFRDMLNVEFVK